MLGRGHHGAAFSRFESSSPTAGKLGRRWRWFGAQSRCLTSGAAGTADGFLVLGELQMDGSRGNTGASGRVGLAGEETGAGARGGGARGEHQHKERAGRPERWQQAGGARPAGARRARASTALHFSRRAQAAAITREQLGGAPFPPSGLLISPTLVFSLGTKGMKGTRAASPLPVPSPAAPSTLPRPGRNAAGAKVLRAAGGSSAGARTRACMRGGERQKAAASGGGGGLGTGRWPLPCRERRTVPPDHSDRVLVHC